MPKKSKQPPQRRSRPPVARSWWWIGGVLVILPLIAVAAGCTGGPGERNSTSMPKNPADRADMYSEPPAMQTVNNFVFLARAGFYDGLTFHRVEPGFVIQGGDPAGTGGGGPGYTVPAEIQLPHVEGAIAMARRGDQVNPTRASSGSQFYITLAPTPFLDGAYTAFGQVTTGMDVVQSIAVGDVIERITITEGP